MSETIIAVLITGLISVITTVITVVVSNKSNSDKMAAELDKRLALTDNEIGHIKADLKEHNGYAKMFATYEAASEEKFKTIFNELAEIKSDIKAINNPTR